MIEKVQLHSASENVENEGRFFEKTSLNAFLLVCPVLADPGCTILHNLKKSRSDKRFFGHAYPTCMPARASSPRLLEVLYQDARCLVLNKPANVALNAGSSPGGIAWTRLLQGSQLSMLEESAY